MTDPPENSEEIPEVCSSESLHSLSKRKNRILFISSDDAKEEFSKKFANTIKSNDLEVVRYRTRSSCDAVRDLGLKDKPAAVFMEKGEVKARIELTGDDVKDASDLTKMVFEKKDTGTCKANFVVDGKGWTLTPESSEQCSNAISKIEEQGPATKKYLKRHIQ